MRSNGMRKIAVAALAAMLPGAAPALATARTAAPHIPKGWKAKNVTPVGYVKLSGPRTFKLGLKEKDGRWFLFVATGIGGTKDSGGFEVVDVTDPARPRSVATVMVPFGTGQLTLNGNLLIAGQMQQFSPPAAGGSVEYPYRGASAKIEDIATLFDISEPTAPRRLSAWAEKGWATHRNTYPGGRYAYMSSWIAGYRGQAVLVMLDVSDPRYPREAGRWWQPGQRENEAELLPPPGFHGPAFPSADGKMLTLGYTPSFLNLDISDPKHIRVIGKLDFSPLAGVGTQAIHSVVPMRDGFFYLSTEPGNPGCDTESLSFAAVVDNRDPKKPRLAAYFPRPLPPENSTYASFCDKEGRFGPHNVNTELHQNAVQQPGTLLYQTYFNAGLRVWNVADPRQPHEAGWFLPKIGSWKEHKRGPEDVIVDRRGYIYTSTGREKGIWVLKYTGATPR